MRQNCSTEFSEQALQACFAFRPPLARKFAAMLSALVAGMTTPQAAATVVAAAYASYCALRYVYRRAHTGVDTQAGAGDGRRGPGGRAAASAPPGRARAFGRAPPSIDG